MCGSRKLIIIGLDCTRPGRHNWLRTRRARRTVLYTGALQHYRPGAGDAQLGHKEPLTPSPAFLEPARRPRRLNVRIILRVLLSPSKFLTCCTLTYERRRRGSAKTEGRKCTGESGRGGVGDPPSTTRYYKLDSPVGLGRCSCVGR